MNLQMTRRSMTGSAVKGGDGMGLFKRKVKNEADAGDRAKTMPIAELNSYFDNSAILDAAGAGTLTAATYYACMLIRCNALAKIPFKVYVSENGGAKTAAAHPLSELLKFRPNPLMTAHDFMWATEFQRLEYGNAFWAYEFSGGKVTALYLFASRSVEILVDDAGILGRRGSVWYMYHDPRKGELLYPSDRILHFKNFAANGIKGTSVKQYMFNVITQEKYAQQVVNERYSKGLQDPIIVVYTGDLNDARKDSIKKKFAKLGGAQSAGQVIPIPSDFDVKQLETKLVNSQFFELNGLTTRHIANAFGVKSFQLNDMEKSTYSNIEQQNGAFYSDTLQNVLTAYEQEITYKLLTSDERQKGTYVKAYTDVLLRSDTRTRYAAYSEAIRGGFLQIAEVRQKEELPFIPGTDKLIFGNGAAVPVDQIGIQYSSAGKGGEESE